MHKETLISNGVKLLEKKIFKKAALILCILILLSVFFKDLKISTGIIAGFFIGIFHFKMIAASAKRMTNFKSTNSARILSIFGVFSRFTILAVLFWLATTKGAAFFAAVVCGFLTIKISIILEGIGDNLAWKA
jgi:hypothetical protein